MQLFKIHIKQYAESFYGSITSLEASTSKRTVLYSLSIQRDGLQQHALKNHTRHLWQNPQAIGLTPNSYTGLVPFFRNKFPGLFQDSDRFFKDSKIHINPYTPKISMLILLTVFHTLHIFKLSLTDFQNFPGPVAFFQDFAVLQNAIIKFQDFLGFPGPVWTLLQEKLWYVSEYWCTNISFI